MEGQDTAGGPEGSQHTDGASLAAAPTWRDQLDGDHSDACMDVDRADQVNNAGAPSHCSTLPDGCGTDHEVSACFPHACQVFPSMHALLPDVVGIGLSMALASLYRWRMSLLEQRSMDEHRRRSRSSSSWMMSDHFSYFISIANHLRLAPGRKKPESYYMASWGFLLRHNRDCLLDLTHLQSCLQCRR